MQNQIQIQALLLKWLKHHGKCSVERIRIACINLSKSVQEEYKQPLFTIFFPLVRKGYIEFCGNGYYQPTQPSILYYNKHQTGVGINLSFYQIENLKGFTKVDENELGIVRFATLKTETSNFAEKNDCEFSVPDVSEILYNFPKISGVIQNFEKASITSTNIQFYNIERGWGKNKNQSTGIFRLSDDSHKFYLRTKNATYQIPDAKINPEGRPLAESYQAVMDGINFITYEKNIKSLIIKTVNIPILIDRVLRIASLFKNDGVCEEYRKTIYSNISYSTVKQLNRIFGIKIKIEE